MPLPTAQKLVSRLAGAGLIESTRGHRRRIRLARDADTISLADIVEAVDGPIALTACVTVLLTIAAWKCNAVSARIGMSSIRRYAPPFPG